MNHKFSFAVETGGEAGTPIVFVVARQVNPHPNPLPGLGEGIGKPALSPAWEKRVSQHGDPGCLCQRFRWFAGCLLNMEFFVDYF